MINHNLLLYQLFDNTMDIEVWGKTEKINYMEGDLFELAKKLEEYNRLNVKKFPLIWLIDGYDVVVDDLAKKSKMENPSFLFITNSVLNDRNKERFATTYKDMLYRVLLRFKKKIDTTSGITRDKTSRIRAYPLKDMMEESKPSANGQPVLSGIWDALYLTLDIEIENECFPELKINL